MLPRSLLNCLTLRPGWRRTVARPDRLAIETLEDRCTPAAMLSIHDADVVEGNDGTQNALVTVRLTEPHGNNVTVSYNTADGSAIAGSDYTAVSGKLTFARNEMSKSIVIPVKVDRLIEFDEYFSVRLANAKGAKIADGTGLVNIMDDEPRISIYDVSQLEKDNGTTSFQFAVYLSNSYDLPVTVQYATMDGTTTAGSDYTTALGTLTFGPNDSSPQMISVAVNGDPVAEPTEIFLVNVTTLDSYAAISRGTGVGTIWDDEPQIFISDAYVYEGDSTITFSVSVSNLVAGETVTVEWHTVDGTAFAGMDYGDANGMLTFTADMPSQTITVAVLDSTSLPDKYFYIHLTNASPNASIAYEWAVGYWYYDYGYSYGWDPGAYWEAGY